MISTRTRHALVVVALGLIAAIAIARDSNSSKGSFACTQARVELAKGQQDLGVPEFDAMSAVLFKALQDSYAAECK